MLATACPHCGTRWRVTGVQLEARDGRVRCGRCGEAFDALPNLRRVVEPAAPASPATPLPRGPSHDAPAGAVATTAETADGPTPGLGPLAALRSRLGRRRDAAAPPPGHRRRTDAPPRRGLRGLLGPGLVAALALLALLQAAVVLRDRVAAQVPALQPALAALVAPLGLSVDLPREVRPLALDASTLDAVGGSTFQFNAVVRNTAPYPVRFPALELTLLDEGGRTATRRLVAAVELVGERAAAGVPARGEVPVRLRFEAGGTAPAGWRARLMQP